MQDVIKKDYQQAPAIVRKYTCTDVNSMERTETWPDTKTVHLISADSALHLTVNDFMSGLCMYPSSIGVS